MLNLGDYADGDWYFIAVCRHCGRKVRLDPADILAQEGAMEKVCPYMYLHEIEALLRCRSCSRKQASIEPLAEVRKQAFIAGMV